jgi:hypothetical protein
MIEMESTTEMVNMIDIESIKFNVNFGTIKVVVKFRYGTRVYTESSSYPNDGVIIDKVLHSISTKENVSYFDTKIAIDNIVNSDRFIKMVADNIIKYIADRGMFKYEDAMRYSRGFIGFFRIDESKLDKLYNMIARVVTINKIFD